MTTEPGETDMIARRWRLPREIEMVYRIEPLRLVYDPAVGSPADDLLNTATSLEARLGSAAPPTQGGAVADLAARIASLSADVAEAHAHGF